MKKPSLKEELLTNDPVSRRAAQVWYWRTKTQSGIRGGPALPPELRVIKMRTLAQAILILHDKVSDPVYVDSLDPDELVKILELVFDRLGLPKIQKSEFSGPNGKPMELNADAGPDLSKLTTDMLETLARKLA